jgi:hypothetical protein
MIRGVLMAKLKTTVSKASVTRFLNSITDEQKKRDCLALVEVMQSAAKTKPEMWGPAIVGFGRYQYKYPSGRIGEWFVAGFSPRKQNLTLYILPGIKRYADQLQRLGKHTTGQSCLYLKSLDGIHMSTLKAVIRRAFRDIKQFEAK